jgi:hypothetical protein
MKWVAVTMPSTAGYATPNTGCILTASISFNRIKGPHICFVFIKSAPCSEHRLNMVPHTWKMREKINKK